MSGDFAVVVSVWVHQGREQEYDALEKRSADIMAQHGGRMVVVVRTGAAAGAAGAPFEIHVLTFPNEADFAAYSADPVTVRLRGVRSQIVARTELSRGRTLSR
ncbi:hypothetical protein GC169_13145 [bacterium]|nr:hypothetical protein [bacterium]